MTHIPILRAGKPYYSLSTARVPHFQTGEAVAHVSQANRGIIAKDFMQARRNQHILQALSVDALLAICQKAADLYEKADLPLGEAMQSPEAYIHSLSSTTGMPESLCRKNMAKITLVLREMRAVLGGLTRDLDLGLLDSGWSRTNGATLSFASQANVLGAILPSNSPGVHGLWLPAVPLKVPLVLRPGSQEPWTPYRIAQALLRAGLPPEALSFYPSDYSGATEILLRSGRSMLFGDQKTVQPWRHDHRVQIHGPGWSKVIIGTDKIDDWEQYIDVIVTSAVANGGRSCLNASGLWVPKYGREIAEAVAKQMAQIEARAMDDPHAEIAAFANHQFARMVSDSIDAQLAGGGALDVTEKIRGNSRFVEAFDTAFLLPTTVFCKNTGHSLAQSEYLFPFISVVEAPQQDMLAEMGNTLVATAITEDADFIRDLFAAPNVDRLNIGPIPTMHISWDQPHEGNLFEHLYRQRSLQISKEYTVA